MTAVGIRELKQQASELIRQVRENGKPVEITYHGKIVARLVPVQPDPRPEADQQAWVDLDSLASEIGIYWPAGLSASQAIAEGRR